MIKNMEVPQLNTQDALKKLIAGNVRFSSGQMANPDISPERRAQLVKGQSPFAVIVSCSDSRVPPELLFNQGLGDLFVVRTAGNIVDPITLGSLEYAVDHLHSSLVVVLGHDKCGAVKAAVDGGEAHGSIGSILEKIAPAVQIAKASGAAGAELYEKATDENIKTTIQEIKTSPIVKHLIADGKLSIIGAKYDLASGVVTFD
jgi:carbonic anhydrase